MFRLILHLRRVTGGNEQMFMIVPFSELLNVKIFSKRFLSHLGILLKNYLYWLDTHDHVNLSMLGAGFPGLISQHCITVLQTKQSGAKNLAQKLFVSFLMGNLIYANKLLQIVMMGKRELFAITEILYLWFRSQTFGGRECHFIQCLAQWGPIWLAS